MDCTPRRILANAKTRSGLLELLELRWAGKTHFELALEGVCQRASYDTQSGSALAKASLSGLGRDRRSADILICGLGLGALLRSTLGHPAITSVYVVEPVSQLVTWNRTHLGNEDLLEDRRTEVVVGDLRDYVAGAPRSYNSMVLDTGRRDVQGRHPFTLTLLAVLRTRIRSGGVLVVRSPADGPQADGVLSEAFETVERYEEHDSGPDGSRTSSAIFVARP